MSQTLKLPNFNSLNILEQSNLTADITSAVTTLPVVNTQDFLSPGYVLIGNVGAKGNEIRSVTAIPTATSLTVPATSLIHRNYDPVYALFGNMLRIYRAPNVNGAQPADAVFTANLLATVTIDPNDSLTQYTDLTGGGTYWYKYTYYNSATGGESNISSSVAVRGSFTVNYCSLDEIRTESGFKYAQYITEDMIDAKRRAAQDEINGALDGFYNTPFQPPINDFIRDITLRLAAGMLMQQQYGQTTPSGKEGGIKVKGARDDLKKLVNKERVLVDKSGTNIALSGGTGGASGWPNSTTDGTQADGSINIDTLSSGQDGGHAFSRKDLLGYYGRQF